MAMGESATADSRSVRVPFGGDVTWPNACCVCVAELPDASLQLEAYAFRWTLPETWRHPIAVFEVPICSRCHRRRWIVGLLRTLGALLLIAGLTFAMAMSGRGHLISEGGVELALVPIALWLWWRFPVGPTAHFDAGAVVLRFRREQFAQAAVVHPPSGLAPPAFTWRN